MINILTWRLTKACCAWFQFLNQMPFSQMHTLVKGNLDNCTFYHDCKLTWANIWSKMILFLHTTVFQPFWIPSEENLHKRNFNLSASYTLPSDWKPQGCYFNLENKEWEESRWSRLVADAVCQTHHLLTSRLEITSIFSFNSFIYRLLSGSKWDS